MHPPAPAKSGRLCRPGDRCHSADDVRVQLDQRPAGSEHDDGTEDRVGGEPQQTLETGADDYLMKPFNLNEFLLRVKGMLRRSSWYRPEPVEEGYRFGDNEVFLLSYHARTAQGEIDLTELEVKMLAFFFAREGHAVSRSTLLETVWGYAADTETRTLDNFIVRLRRYFEQDPSHPVHFQTVRGVGYRAGS